MVSVFWYMFSAPISGTCVIGISHYVALVTSAEMLFLVACVSYLLYCDVIIIISLLEIRDRPSN